MELLRTFGNRVKLMRQHKGISQEELAFRAHLHRTYISSIELGKRNVSLLNIAKIADALGCEVSSLFEKEK